MYAFARVWTRQTRLQVDRWSSWQRAGLPLAVALAVGVTAYDVWATALPVSKYLFSGYPPPGFGTVAERSGGLLAIVGVQALYFWGSYQSPRPVQLMALACFAVATFLEYGFVAGAGAPMNIHDITMAFENVKYWPSMIRAFLDWRALVPATAYALTLLPHRPVAPRWGRTWAGVLAATLGLHSVFAVVHYIRHQADDFAFGLVVPPMTSFEAVTRTFTLYAFDQLHDATSPRRRAAVTYRAATVPRRHVLLVIDESVCAHHLSLDGYPRETTPWLQDLQRRGKASNWGPIASAATYSDASVLSLLTGFNAPPDIQKRSLTLPTIFQFAKAMNYRTHLFDGEQTWRRYGLSWADMRFVDDWRNAGVFGDDPGTDIRVAKAALAVLQDPDGQFIVLLKRGVHEPPEQNYPRGQGRWRPSRDGTIPPGQDLIADTNSYDDAIRYNLDAFFQALLAPDGGLPRTVGIYTSDHGEMLAEHGGTPFMRTLSAEVTTVPLLMFGDDRVSVDTGYRASHHNIFATLLDLMNVPAAIRPWSYGRSLLTARSTDYDSRPVLGGYMFGGTFAYEVKDYDALERSPKVEGRVTQ